LASYKLDLLLLLTIASCYVKACIAVVFRVHITQFYIQVKQARMRRPLIMEAASLLLLLMSARPGLAAEDKSEDSHTGMK
jgi:hypothetical protein